MRRRAAVLVATALAAGATVAGCERVGDPLVAKLPDAQVDAVVVPDVDASPDAGPIDGPPADAGPDATPADAGPDAAAL
jgi:hypothetical protein